MTLTLVDDPTVFPLTVSVPSNGEARNAESVQTPFQQLANRTANTKAKIDALAPLAIVGINLLYRVANDAALLAIGASIHTDKSICIVDGVGLYEYDVASTATASVPFVRTPTDVGGGAGRWILVGAGYALINAALGIPRLDSSARVPAPLVRNGVVLTAHAEVGTTSTNVGTPSFFTVPGSSLTLAGLEVGDVVSLDFWSVVQVVTVSVLTLQAFVTLPDTTIIIPTNMSLHQTNSSAFTVQYQPFGAAGTYVVSQAGTHTIGVRMQSDGTSTNSLVSMNMRAMVIRP